MAESRTPRITVLHGPNLDRLGTREPEIYGHHTLETIDREIVDLARSLGYEAGTHQTGDEGEMIRLVHRAGDESAGIILNAGAWTHTSYALRDAVATVRPPVIEVHLSNVYAREAFRHRSVIEDLVVGKILGFGKESYLLAVRAMDAILRRNLAKP